MALRRQTAEIPEGAVILTEAEAIQHQWKIISSWKPAADVWPFKYGLAISAFCSSATSIYINNHYRRKLRLANHGRIASYLPIVIIPAIAASLFHQSIMSDIMIMKSACPVCVQIRSSSYQAFFGAMYPVLLAPLSSFMLATRYYTYVIPPVQTMPLEALKLGLKLTRPIQGVLVTAALGQALVGSVLAYMEMKSIVKINKKIDDAKETEFAELDENS